MSEFDDLKPIEEIDNDNAVEPKQEMPTALTPPSAPQANSVTSEPPISAPQAPQAPQAPAAPMPSQPGKKAVIKRSGGDTGWVKYILLAFAVLVIGAGVFYYFFYRVTFEINPTPTPDKILLDSNQVQPGTYRVKPGVHTLDIEKAGYISYISSRKYSFGEHIVLNFKFQAEKTPIISIAGAKLETLSSDKSLLFFLDSNSSIAVTNLSDATGKVTELSNGQYPTARIMKVSKDESFALVLDNEAIKIINFNKTDLINQSETKLPPLASGIHSITWDNNESQYFPAANSKILYDLQSSTSWDVFLANISHTQADIILQIDKNVFPNLFMDWGDNQNKVLITGGEIGVLDISKRDYQKIATDKQFSWGRWSPDGQKAVAVDTQGGVWVYQNNSLTRLPFDSKPSLVNFIDNINIAAVSQGRPVKYNFDTKQETNYAEVKGLTESSTFITKADVFYFETADGIFSGKFEASGY